MYDLLSELYQTFTRLESVIFFSFIGGMFTMNEIYIHILKRILHKSIFYEKVKGQKTKWSIRDV